MTRKLQTVRPTDSATLASQFMLWASVRHLLVIDGTKLVGLLSDRDLLRVKEAFAKDVTVADIMTREPMVIDLDATLDDAAAKMAGGRIGCLPVVQGGALVGILTSTDILAERGRLIHKGRAAGGTVPHVGSIMRRNVAFVTRDTTLLAAIEKLLLADVRHLPVLDEELRVVGMLSDRDAREAMGDIRDALYRRDRSALETTRVEDVMTHAPTTISADASVLDLADELIDERIGAIVVVDDDDRMVGIVSYVDVLAFAFGRLQTA
ncbi:MAG: CBS domain-containing protein [Polyangiaceae bacterium]|nr:CBS domain-containing protein [Polyangiaceae bacterium]